MIVQQNGEDWGPNEGFEDLTRKVMEKFRALRAGCVCGEAKDNYGFLHIGDVEEPRKQREWFVAVAAAKAKGAALPEENRPPNRQLHVIYCTKCNGLTHAYASDEMMEHVPELRKLLPAGKGS